MEMSEVNFADLGFPSYLLSKTSEDVSKKTALAFVKEYFKRCGLNQHLFLKGGFNDEGQLLAMLLLVQLKKHGKSVFMVNANHLANCLINLKQGSLDEPIKFRLFTSNVVAVDAIGIGNLNDWETKEVASFIERRVSSGGPTVLLSDLSDTASKTKASLDTSLSPRVAYLVRTYFSILDLQKETIRWHVS